MNKILVRSFVGLCFMVLLLASSQAQASYKIPDCATLEAWVTEIPSSDVSLSEEARLKRIEGLFSDGKIIPVFGISFMKWSPVESDLAFDRLNTCVKEADAAGRNRSRKQLALVAEQFKKAQKIKRAGFKQPECIFVYQWISRGIQLPSNLSAADLSDEVKGKIMYADSYIVPLFGLAYEKWTDDRKVEAKKHLSACRARMSEKSDKKIAEGLDFAVRFIK